MRTKTTIRHYLQFHPREDVRAILETFDMECEEFARELEPIEKELLEDARKTAVLLRDLLASSMMPNRFKPSIEYRAMNNRDAITAAEEKVK